MIAMQHIEACEMMEEEKNNGVKLKKESSKKIFKKEGEE